MIGRLFWLVVSFWTGGPRVWQEGSSGGFVRLWDGDSFAAEMKALVACIPRAPATRSRGGTETDRRFQPISHAPGSGTDPAPQPPLDYRKTPNGLPFSISRGKSRNLPTPASAKTTKALVSSSHLILNPPLSFSWSLNMTWRSRVFSLSCQLSGHEHLCIGPEPCLPAHMTASSMPSLSCCRDSRSTPCRMDVLERLTQPESYSNAGSASPPPCIESVVPEWQGGCRLGARWTL